MDKFRGLRGTIKVHFAPTGEIHERIFPKTALTKERPENHFLDFLKHSKPIIATVMAVRAATGFSDGRDCRAVYEVARTAAATMMEVKTAKPPKAKLLWLKSSPHRSFTSTVKGMF